MKTLIILSLLFQMIQPAWSTSCDDSSKPADSAGITYKCDTARGVWVRNQTLSEIAVDEGNPMEDCSSAVDPEACYKQQIIDQTNKETQSEAYKEMTKAEGKVENWEKGAKKEILQVAQYVSLLGFMAISLNQLDKDQSNATCKSIASIKLFTAGAAVIALANVGTFLYQWYKTNQLSKNYENFANENVDSATAQSRAFEFLKENQIIIRDMALAMEIANITAASLFGLAGVIAGYEAIKLAKGDTKQKCPIREDGKRKDWDLVNDKTTKLILFASGIAPLAPLLKKNGGVNKRFNSDFSNYNLQKEMEDLEKSFNFKPNKEEESIWAEFAYNWTNLRNKLSELIIPSAYACNYQPAPGLSRDAAVGEMLTHCPGMSVEDAEETIDMFSDMGSNKYGNGGGGSTLKTRFNNDSNTGGSTTNTNSGGSTTNTNSGGSTTNTNSGGSTTNTNSGGSTTNTNSGGSTTNTNSGGSTTNTNSGGSTTNTNSGGGEEAAAGVNDLKTELENTPVDSKTKEVFGEGNDKIKKALESPWTRFALSSLASVASGFLADYYAKLYKLAKARIKRLDEISKQIGDTYICTDTDKADAANIRCYCYTYDSDTKEFVKRTDRSSSTACQSAWNRDDAEIVEGGNYKSAGNYSSLGCLTNKNSYDSTCSCLQKTTKSGENSCNKALKKVKINFDFGQVKWNPQTYKDANNVLSNGASLTSVDTEAALDNSAKMQRYMEKMTPQLDKALKKQSPKASMAKLTKKLGSSIMKNMPTNFANSSGRSSFGSLGGKALDSLKKAEEDAGIKGSGSLYGDSAAAASARQGKGSNGDELFGFGEEESASAGGASTEEYMDKSFKMNVDDIRQNSGESIFKIISNRYTASGLRRLFKESNE